MTLYLDANATTPIDPRVRELMIQHLTEEVGNAASAHEFGERAKELVHRARDQIGHVVGARRHEVVFTSGATESNNLALLGMQQHGIASGRKHIVSTRIEHKAVLEPLQVLKQAGFEVTLIAPDPSGRIATDRLLAAVRPDTLLVSVMHVNNETGVVQPIEEIAGRLEDRSTYFHVDAAQGFGRDLKALQNPRIDLISVSGHKIHGPQGIGALILRRREHELPPLRPLLYGGGQELGLRPGTLPVHQIIAMGLAAELAEVESSHRRDYCLRLRQHVDRWIKANHGTVHGHPAYTLPHVMNVSLPNRCADEVMDLLRGVAAVSDGAACTSICATASHVLSAMGVREPLLSGAVRISWSYLTDEAQLIDSLEAATRRLSSITTSAPT